MASKRIKADPGAVLTYEPYRYLPYYLDTDDLSEAQKRAEYSRLRAIAVKRQQRMQGSELAGSRFARESLPKLKELTSSAALNQQLARMAQILRSRSSTITGAREQIAERVEALQETFADDPRVDFENFSPDDWAKFGAYMKTMKARGYADKGADSGRAVKMYFLAKDARLTTHGLIVNYEEFTERQAELENYADAGPSGRARSAAYILGQLDNGGY